MKKVKKLSLKKETIAILDNTDMKHLFGGNVPTWQGNCLSFNCTITPPGGYTSVCGGGGGSVASCGCVPTPSRSDNTCTRWPSDGYVC